MACDHATPVEGCPDCAGTFVKTPGAGADGPAARSLSFPSPGTQAGRYVLLEQIGEGAMGLVFAANDPELDRKVAIKLFRPSRSEPGSLSMGQTRLLREAQAMAKLSHPNVIPIYDAGAFEDGVFLAMELVEGQTLLMWMREARHSWKEVLRIYRQAGQGLSAAHKAGIIHRDFKPANVLIGADGRARVGDFGIARATDAEPPLPRKITDVAPTEPLQSLAPSALAPGSLSGPGSSRLSAALTVAGSVMGTPGYMAPEQYLGQVATALTDQFSFCASLYEALYGYRPFPGATLDEASASTRAGRPLPRPKDSRVPAWVDRIVLRGLSVEPPARYPSMDGLLEALGNDPAVARRKWAAAAAGMVVLLGAVVGARAWSHRHDGLCAGASQRLAGVWDPDVAAQAQAGLQATQLPFVGPTWTAVKTELDHYAAQWAATFTDACEATRRRGEQSEQALDLRMACLEDRREAISALAAMLGKADAKVAENAVAAARALPALERCSDLAALAQPTALPSDPAARARIEAVQKDLAQAKAQYHLGKMDDAKQIAQRVVESARETHYPPLIAGSLAALADIESTRSDSKSALPLYEEAFAAAEVARSDDLAASALLGIAQVQGVSLSHPEQGLVSAVLADGVLERAGRPLKLEANRHRMVGSLSTIQGDPDRALAELHQALELHERLGDPLEIAKTLSSLGWAQLDRGDIAGARESLTRSLHLREGALGSDHPALLSSYNELSRLEQAESNFDLSEAYLRKGAKLNERIFGLKNRRACVFASNITNSLVGALRWREAVSEARDALALCTEVLGKDHPDLGVAHLMLGVALRGDGKPLDALAEHRLAGAHMERVQAAHPPFYCMVQRERGEDLLALGKAADALTAAQTAERCFGEGKVEGGRMSEVLLTEGRALAKLSRAAEAVPLLQRSLELCVAAKEGPEDQAEVQFVLAQALWKTKPQEARRQAREAEEKFQSRKRERDAHQVALWRAGHG
jgi:tetratricopeptide (TPR) repeat protein